jgi:hypothetical protein
MSYAWSTDARLPTAQARPAFDSRAQDAESRAEDAESRAEDAEHKRPDDST